MVLDLGCGQRRDALMFARVIPDRVLHLLAAEARVPMLPWPASVSLVPRIARG